MENLRNENNNVLTEEVLNKILSNLTVGEILTVYNNINTEDFCDLMQKQIELKLLRGEVLSSIKSVKQYYIDSVKKNLYSKVIVTDNEDVWFDHICFRNGSWFIGYEKAEKVISKYNVCAIKRN